jgi:hypothetical protein
VIGEHCPDREHIRNAVGEFCVVPAAGVPRARGARIAENQGKSRLNSGIYRLPIRGMQPGTRLASVAGDCVYLRKEDHVRRAFTDILMSGAALVLLLLVLIAVDPRVRDQFSWHSVRPATDLAYSGQRVRSMVTTIYVAARDQSLEHTALTMFVVSGIVLVLFMIRT